MAKNGARAALRSPATATSMALAGKAPVQPAKGWRAENLFC
jgi:hypothetical protein